MVGADLERALRLAALVAPARWDEVTGSTNDTALQMAEAGTPEWTLVGANHQTEGKGRLGREWIDDPGGALMVSLVLRPALEPSDAGILTVLAGLAWAEAASAASGRQVRCKWPNDLLLDDRKAGGILSESALDLDGGLRHVVIGSGINLEAPPGVAEAAGLGPRADPTELLGDFLRRFSQGYGTGGDAAADMVSNRWRQVSASAGRRVRARRLDGQSIEGVAVDIDHGGSLIVETADGLATVTSGELEHLR